MKNKKKKGGRARREGSWRVTKIFFEFYALLATRFSLRL